MAGYAPHLVGLTLCTACLASFQWGILCFFRRSGAMPPSMRLVQALGAGVGVWHLVALATADLPVPPVLAAGWLLYGASLALFWWSVLSFEDKPPTLAFSEDTPTHLVTAGPYGWVRHPFYTSYAAAWMAGVVTTGRPVLIVTVVVMSALYVASARLEERKFLRSRLADEYRAYKAVTGILLPRLRPRRSDHAM